jgi:hypothetical protein
LGPLLVATTSHSRQSPAAPIPEVQEKGSDSMDVDEKPEVESHNGQASGMTPPLMAIAKRKAHTRSPGPPSTRHETEEPPSAEDNQEQDEDDKAVAQAVEWSDLDMNQKLDAMHTLVEWQFQNPLRLRQIMKSDDELASWVRCQSPELPVNCLTWPSGQNQLDTTSNRTHTG